MLDSIYHYYTELPSAPGLADSDPHFIVKVKGLKYAICFDVMGEQGDVYELIKDKYSGKCHLILLLSIL